MSESERGLLEQFIRIQWLLGRYHYHNHRAGPMGNPYRGQGRVLKLLKMQPEISQKDLLELLDMRPQSLGELLAKLESNGYITRSPSETDKRVMMVHLTEKGAEEGVQDEVRPGFAEVLQCLSEEEQVNLNDYLGRITAELEKRVDAADGDWSRGRGQGRRVHGEFEFGFGPGFPFNWRK